MNDDVNWRTRRTIAAAALIGTSLLAGCGNGATSGSKSTTTTTSPGQESWCKAVTGYAVARQQASEAKEDAEIAQTKLELGSGSYDDTLGALRASRDAAANLVDVLDDLKDAEPPEVLRDDVDILQSTAESVSASDQDAHAAAAVRVNRFARSACDTAIDVAPIYGS